MVYRLTMGLQATAEIAERRDWTQSSLLSLQLVIAYRMAIVLLSSTLR